MARESDRWITPRVVIVAVTWFGLLSLVAIGCVTWLTAIGRDPGPMVETVAQLVGTLGILANLAVTLASRAGVAKVERNTRGGYVPPPEDATAPLYGRHGQPSRAAPAPRGS